MKKSEKLELAKRNVEEIDRLGINVTFDKGFMFITPPRKVSSELMINLTKANDETIQLLKERTLQKDKNGKK